MESKGRGRVSKEAKEKAWLSSRWKKHKTYQEHPAKNNPTGYPTEGRRKKERWEGK